MKPVYTPDEVHRPSARIERLRDMMSSVRGEIHKFVDDFGFKESIEHVSGLLTCGLVTLYNVMEEMMKHEIKSGDRLRGEHIKFRPRGIGLDMCPCCFVCGTTERKPDSNAYLHNISGFVSSKENGQEIVDWFGGFMGPETGCTHAARLDFREREPNWIQLKVGSCEAHLPNLRHLYALTSQYGVIRQIDIKEARDFVEPPSAEPVAAPLNNLCQEIPLPP